MTLHQTTALIPTSPDKLKVAINFTHDACTDSVFVTDIEHLGGPALAFAFIDDRPEVEAACWAHLRALGVLMGRAA